jgi:type IV pilus assembly protein PilM
MPTVIGLDLGTQRVKAAVVRGRGTRLSVVSYHERVLPMAESRADWLTALSPALAGLHGELRPGSGRVIVCLPGQLAILRSVTVPFTRRNEIEAVLDGQTEAQLPVPVEEVVLEYEIVRQEGNQSHLFVAAILKSDLKEILGVLEKAGFVPESVTLDLFALSNAVSRFNDKVSTGNALVLDLGAGATKAVFLAKGRLASGRAFRIGGHALTSGVQQAMGADSQAAETMKVEAGDLASLSSESVRMKVEETYGRIAREARMFLASMGHAGAVDTLVLTGGGSPMKGIEAALDIGQTADVLRLLLDSGVRAPSGLSGKPEQLGACLSVVLGSCLPALGTGLKAHNFLRNGLLTRRDRPFQGALAACLTLLAIVFGLVCFRLHREASHYGATLKSIRADQERIWREAFPERPELPQARVVQRMDDRIAELEAQVRAAAGAPERRSALSTLCEVLRRVPPGRQFAIHRVNVTPSVVNLTGETDSLKGAMAIERSIDDSPLLTCKLSSADKLAENAGSKPRRVRFQLEIRSQKPNGNGVPP